ncbi:MAG: carbohydrate ABC transporter permease [Bacteroidota bacterium]
MARARSLARTESREFWLFVAPWLIGFGAFTVVPLVLSIGISLARWDILTPPRFVGLGNYLNLLSDPKVWGALRNTLFYTAFGVPATLLFGLGVAILVNQRLRGLEMLRTMYYLPMVLSGVAAALLWKWILNPVFGILNHLLVEVHLPPLGWLTDPLWAKPAIVIYRSWYIGGTMMIFLAALRAIPAVFYEAAIVDGAGAWQKFRRITLPMLTPAISFTVITGIINSLQIFTEVYVMIGTTADDHTRPLLHYIWLNAFSYHRMGYASALSWLLFSAILCVTLVQLGLQRKWVYYEAER